jgi:3-phenylpropionate/trans-cinnamate dioxygenase ferredoxin reductase subunit
MVGNESAPAYRRPSLLHSILEQSGPEFVLPDTWFEDEKVDLRLGTLVSQIDLERRIAVLNTGQAVEFRKACLATGSRVRRCAVAGVNLGNIFHLRTVRDMLALREVLETESNLVVIGGGCVAAEAAAVLSQLGKVRVTLMHRGRHLWSRRLDEVTAAWLTEYFAERGVKMLMGEALNGFEGRTVLKNVQTKSGLRVPAGLAVLALGVEPNLGLVANTPLSYPTGTPVNEFLETDEKGVFAVGDIAAYPDKFYMGVRRLDEIEGTIAQGHLAGANITGKKRQRFEWMPHRKLTVFDLNFDFVGDFGRPPTRVEFEGGYSKKDFQARYFYLESLMGILLCNQSAEAVAAAKVQLVHRPRDLKRRAA